MDCFEDTVRSFILKLQELHPAQDVSAPNRACESDDLAVLVKKKEIIEEKKRLALSYVDRLNQELDTVQTLIAKKEGVPYVP